MADAKQASLAQIAIAWAIAQGEDIVPIIGARRIDQVETMIGSADITLDADDLARIEELVPRGAVRGDRYPTEHMKDPDSER